MNTIKITAAQSKQIADFKSPWVVLQYGELVKVCKNREEARADKRCLPDSEIDKASEYTFEVVELVTEVPVTLGLPMTDPTEMVNQPAPKVAPIGGEIKGNVHDYLCPHCGISLENGVGDHLQEVNGKQIKHDKYEFACLACGGEFGMEIKKTSKAAKTGRKVEVTHLSTVERPCKKVWAIADEMHTANPDCKRREVLAECVNQGIAFYTARTQYQQWMGIQKEMAERVSQQATKK